MLGAVMPTLSVAGQPQPGPVSRPQGPPSGRPEVGPDSVSPKAAQASLLSSQN